MARPKSQAKPKSRRGKRPSDVLADQLPTLRKLVGLTQAELGERLERQGSDLRAYTVAKIETHQREVSLNEALELAAALGIYPMHLFLPREKDATARLGRRSNRTNFTASQLRHWLAGEIPLPLPDHEEDIYELARSEDEKTHREAAKRGMRHVNQEELEEEERMAREIVALLRSWKKGS